MEERPPGQDGASVRGAGALVKPGQPGARDPVWLITGGCGFIGRRLVAKLLDLGFARIRILDNLSVGTRLDLAAVTPFSEWDPLADEPPSGSGVEPVHLVVGDIKDEQLVASALQGTDVLVHLAANTGVAPSVEDPRSDCMTNVVGTLNCLEAARANGVDRFVFASSGAPIGECTPPIHEELAPHPVSPYGASKLAGEGYCSAYYRTFGVETVALRFGNVYGPGSGHKSSVVAKFIRNALVGEALEIYGDGEQTRDYIYIDDLLNAVLAAASEPGVAGEIFQIATSAETTVNELAAALEPVLHRAGVEELEIRSAPPRKGDVRRNYSDTSKAREILGWEAAVSLTEGLQRTVDWFVANRDQEITADGRESEPAAT